MNSLIKHLKPKFNNLISNLKKFTNQASNYARNYSTKSAKSANPASNLTNPTTKVLDIERSFGDTSIVYKLLNEGLNIKSGCYDKDLQSLFTEKNSPVKSILNKHFDNYQQFSPLIQIEVQFKLLKNGEVQNLWFTCNNKWPIRNKFEIDSYVKDESEHFNTTISQYEGRGSGWVYQKITRICLRLRKYIPSTGASFIELPAALKSTRAYVNVKNKDEQCFKYAVLSALHPIDHADRACRYKKYLDTLNWDQLEFPLELSPKNFECFERNNNIGLNVHILNNRTDLLPFPYYTSKIKDPNSKDVINLLCISDETGKKHHYCWMKHPSRALSKLTRHNAKQYPCLKCYNMYATTNDLMEHSKNCLVGKSPQIQKLPNHCKTCDYFNKDCEYCKNSRTLKFRNYYAKQPIPVKLICDTEAISESCNTKVGNKSEINAHQKAAGYCIYFDVADEYKEVFKEFDGKVLNYTGPDMGKHFLETVLENTRKISHIINDTNMPIENLKPLTLPKELICHICDGRIRDKPHKDHDHLTGRFRGFAHMGCNEKYTLKNKSIPVIFHNWKGYDSKMIIHDIGKIPDLTFNPIVENSEKIKAMTVYDKIRKNSFIFIDSFAHMSTSIETLTENLANFTQGSFPEFIENSDIKTLRRSFPAVSKYFTNDKKFKLILRKGVFPYSYLDSLDRLDNTQLLSKQDFFNVLTNKEISDDDYNFYKKVWSEFEMTTFREYYDLYLLLDTLLLADICRAYTNVCFEKYELDPFWFITAPSLSWQAALKTTKIKLDLISDIDMYNFVKNGIKGGVSYVAKKYSKANNKYMKNFDPQKTSKFIDVVDANNLYGWSMMQPLPYKNFKWITTDKILPQSPNIGHIYEVDLKYPSNLHNLHNDFPLMPTKHLAEGSKAEKLVPHLNDRKNYIVDCVTLHYYIKLGIVVEKIHKTLEYSQKPWLKPYIDINTKARQNAKSEFEKSFYKLLNNSVYGQCLMDVTKFVDFDLITSKEKYEWRLRKPYLIKNEPWTFRCKNCQDTDSDKECTEEDSCVIAIEKIKTTVFLNRPMYLGFKVLELSKQLMYEFWYDYLKPSYQDKIKLLCTDTDSFIFEIECDDICSEMNKYKNMFDFSNYGKKHPMYSDLNKKVPGKFKREYPGTIICEFVGLLSKCYSFKFEESEASITKAKGVNSACLKHEDYVKVLRTQIPLEVTQNRLVSKKQQMYLISQNKTALSCNDDKRYWDNNPEGNTLAWGHRDLRNNIVEQ